MKKIFFLLNILLLNACGGKNDMPKPNNLIEKPTMEKIMYDLALLQALRGYAPQKFKENQVEPRTYIYQKYKIDSAQFSESNKYYSGDLDDYKMMLQNVTDKLQKEKTILDSIIKKEEKVKAQKTKDSLAKHKKKNLLKTKS